MGRRRRSNDAGIAEAIAGLAVLGVLGWMFSPQFRALVILAIIVAGACLAIWICYRIITKRNTASPFPPPALENSQTQLHVESPFTGGLRVSPPVRKPAISEQLRKIDWFQFEKLIELIYRHRGYSVQRLGGANPDGGVDLIIESTTEKLVVQCKHWKKWSVGVRQIREFLGTLTDTKIQKGIFITLTGYSGEAKQLADKHGIQILNESDVIRMLEQSGLVYSQEISALLSDSRKYCPKCESELVMREARITGNQFWGCSTYPRCKFTLKFDSEQ
ncbi:MAG: restriction endonuclease [Verrucomicrobia bacterium]|nr:restriction endonuclease [Verrucomicrobiota bacterium]